LIYLDDIIVFAPDVDTHIHRLEEVFIRLQTANLKLKPETCTLFAKRIIYLGHIVSSQGVKTDEEKIQAIKNWPPPQHKKDVWSFMATCSYYQKFIKHFSKISRPLSQVSSKYFQFNQAFDLLRKHLSTAPILAYPDYSLPFILDTYVSAVGIGGVLSQVQDRQECVISYYSKMMSVKERNYCVTGQELLAIVKSITHFKP